MLKTGHKQLSPYCLSTLASSHCPQLPLVQPLRWPPCCSLSIAPMGCYGLSQFPHLNKGYNIGGPCMRACAWLSAPTGPCSPGCRSTMGTLLAWQSQLPSH